MNEQQLVDALAIRMYSAVEMIHPENREAPWSYHDEYPGSSNLMLRDDWREAAKAALTLLREQGWLEPPVLACLRERLSEGLGVSTADVDAIVDAVREGRL